MYTVKLDTQLQCIMETEYLRSHDGNTCSTKYLWQYLGIQAHQLHYIYFKWLATTHVWFLRSAKLSNVVRIIIPSVHVNAIVQSNNLIT